MKTNRAAIIAEIAQRHLELDTLETRQSDSLDFKEQAVWDIEAALAEAFERGRADGARSATRSARKFADVVKS